MNTLRRSRLSLLSLLPMTALVACSGSDPSNPQATAPSIFENPPELSPDAKGVRDLHFAPTEITIEGKRYCMRGYNGSIPGPTIRIPAGSDRKVRVNLHNEFSKSDYRGVATTLNTSDFSCHDFNMTNLHAHGLHVQPNYATDDAADPCTGDGCGMDGKYYGDNVLIEVNPGASAQYRWDVDEDGAHDAGLDWYHPHIHGSTGIQVTNGATGALIVEGDIDQVPGIKNAKERVMVLNQLPYDQETTKPLAEGEACTEATLSANDFSTVEASKPTLVNGKQRPHVKTSPNQIERLRIVYAGAPDEMGIKLHEGKDAECNDFDKTPIDITQYARDGIAMPQFYVSDTMWVSPGYRVEAVVKMPAEKKTLCMVTRRVNDLLGSVIAIFDVDEANGPATETEMPKEADVAAIARPVSWMGTVEGVMQEVSCESVKTTQQKVVLLVPTPGEEPMPGMPHEFGPCDPNDHMHEGSSGPVCSCPAPNINCRRFDDRRARNYRSDRVMTVGTSEKWEINAFDGHPFHIHINPFVVCPNNSNKEPNFPHWRDTRWVQFEDGPQEFLMEFRKFTGQYVLHCHKLNHEDVGMMERVEICNPDDNACLCQGTDGMGNCISQAGCQADDMQCQFAKTATDAYPLPPAPNPALCGP